MADSAEDNIREVLWVYRDRLVDLKKDNRLVHGMLFKNVGAAGRRQPRAHPQPVDRHADRADLVWEEMTGSLEFFNYRGRCIYCDMIQQELATEKRIVLDTPHFIAFCPFASRFPFETWIVPKAHSSHYENIPKPGVDDLAHAETGPHQAGASARQPGLQLHHSHRALRPPRVAALSLAHRDHSAADQGRPASSGARVSTSIPFRPKTPPLSCARLKSSPKAAEGAGYGS